MAGRGALRTTCAASLIALCLLGWAVPSVSVWADETAKYSFEILPDGTPRFTQVLRWNGDPNVLYYEVTLETSDGKPISISKIVRPVLTLNLPPGNYRYRIEIYNLLRKPAGETPWRLLTILKAEIPRLAGCEPKVWFLEDHDPVLTIGGQNLVSGAAFILRKAGAEPLHSIEVKRSGTSALTVTFREGAAAPGEYSLEVVNPSGLSSTISNALLIRHKLPPPTGLEPSSAVLGPQQLRGMKALTFSWNAVPEATQYIFSLYRGSDGKPFIRTTVRDHVFEITDLASLDRGNYRWTIEPLAVKDGKVVIPAAKDADARFTIALPRLAAPKLNSGDLFYGW